MHEELKTKRDFETEQALRQQLAKTERNLAEAQEEIGFLYDEYETARLHEYAAGALCQGITQSRLDSLAAAAEASRAKLEQARTEVEAPYGNALQALGAHINRIVGAATGWLSWVGKHNGKYHSELDEFISTSIQKLRKMGERMAPLSEIVDFFEDCSKRIETWQFPESSKQWMTSDYYLPKMELPRLADFLNR